LYHDIDFFSAEAVNGKIQRLKVKIPQLMEQKKLEIEILIEEQKHIEHLLPVLEKTQRMLVYHKPAIMAYKREKKVNDKANKQAHLMFGKNLSRKQRMEGAQRLLNLSIDPAPATSDTIMTPAVHVQANSPKAPAPGEMSDQSSSSRPIVSVPAPRAQGKKAAPKKKGAPSPTPS
jgi:hypothetical protein